MSLQDQVGIDHLVRWAERDPHFRRFEVVWSGPLVQTATRWSSGWRVRLSTKRKTKSPNAGVLWFFGETVLAAAMKATSAFPGK